MFNYHDLIDRMDGYRVGTLIVENGMVCIESKEKTTWLFPDTEIEVKNGEEYQKYKASDALRLVDDAGWPLLAGMYVRVKGFKMMSKHWDFILENCSDEFIKAVREDLERCEIVDVEMTVDKALVTVTLKTDDNDVFIFHTELRYSSGEFMSIDREKVFRYQLDILRRKELFK